MVSWSPDGKFEFFIDWEDVIKFTSKKFCDQKVCDILKNLFKTFLSCTDWKRSQKLVEWEGGRRGSWNFFGWEEKFGIFFFSKNPTNWRIFLKEVGSKSQGSPAYARGTKIPNKITPWKIINSSNFFKIRLS